MRCKCGFNSFDHHLVCPKCHKDLTATRRLLNLDVPAPGMVNFFQIAGQRMAVPRPFLGAAVGSEDLGEDLRPVEDIRPITYGAHQPPPLEMAISAQPLPGTAACGAGEMPPASSQAFAGRPEEPMFEIEVTDAFEVVRPGSRPRSEAIFTPINPAPHQAIMDQIKSTLTETGDLNPKTEPSLRGEGGTPGAPASNRAGAADEEGDDDLSSLVGDLNLDELERYL